MVSPYSQWLFLITDQTDTDPSIFLPTVEDGQNVAFLYNNSDPVTANVTRVGDQNNLKCVTSAMIETYVLALHQVIRAEETRYFQTTEDDWSRSKPSTRDRSNEIYRTLKVCAFSIL